MFPVRSRFLGLVGLAVLAFGPAPRTFGQEYKYLGSKTCKKCHFKLWQNWSQTRMANAFQVLKPNAALKPGHKTGLTKGWIDQIKANKTKAQPPIDPEKDYTNEAKCLKCHTTGYGQPGGYAIPDPKDKRAKRRAKKLEGVGCESCHGPGSAYVKIMKEIQDKQRHYKLAELAAAGLTKIEPKLCAKCHNAESPLVGPGYVFDYAKRSKQGVHKLYGLKLREN